MKWIKLNKNYSLSEDCRVKSHERKQEFGTQFKLVPERILKPSKTGYVRISCHQQIHVKRKYLELFGKEWEG